MSGPDHSAAMTSRLDAVFAPWNRTDSPGLVVGIHHRGQSRYRRAFGMASLEAGAANTVATRMRIGSTSKHFLALLALLLEQEDLIDLDRRIGHYLPELTGYNAEPTVRQLLQHRGGTRCHIDLGFIGHGILAAPEGSALRTLGRQSGRNFPTGTAMIYNNGGYHLVSHAISRIMGEPLATLLKRRLFDPLEMDATSLVPSDYMMTPGIASLHLPGSDGLWRRGLFPSLEILGEGGIVSSLDDMLRWAAHLRSGHILGLDNGLTRLVDVPDEADGSPGYYGLGLMRRTYKGIRTYRHSGGVPGGACELVCAPDVGLDIIIMSNGAPDASPSLLADAIMDIVLGDLVEPIERRPDAADFAPWLGHYGSAETGIVYSLEQRQGATCLRIAKYAVSVPLEGGQDGWLATGLTGIGTVRIRREGLDGGEPAIRVRFAGQEERLVRLPSNDGALTAPALSSITGLYESAESGMTALIERQDDRLELRVRDRWGTSTFELLPLGGYWLHIRSWPDPDQFGATLWFHKGWLGSFVLNSARTRNLPFERM